jgi:hypothetical protein
LRQLLVAACPHRIALKIAYLTQQPQQYKDVFLMLRGFAKLDLADQSKRRTQSGVDAALLAHLEIVLGQKGGMNH